MDILKKINLYKDKINESGIRNITSLGKEYKTAEIYFHIDLDGITSAIGMKSYLKSYGIRTIDAHPIQYGGLEYSVPKPKDKTLAVLVDFAHGKPVMHIHTDHHDKQAGVEKGTATSFVKSPSNAAYISQVLSPNDLFTPNDAKIINTVDSADFASQGITPDDVMRAVFTVDKKLDIEKNHKAMGLATNKLVLAYKNKPGFLKKLVMQSKPSLISMYNITKKLAKEEGYKAPEDVQKGTFDYADVQKTKGLPEGKLSDVKTLKNGQSVMIGTTIVQNGGGSMLKGYDRYTPFKNNPEADFFTIIWPVGLIQLSKNPFKSAKNPYHLGDLVMSKVMTKFKSKLQGTDITLETIKYMFERDIKKDWGKVVGFTFKDALALFNDKLRGIKTEKFGELVSDIANKPYKFLSKKQKDILAKVSISAWDLIMAQSGGHKDITNISGFNFLGKGYVDFMKEVQYEIAKLMKDKKLESME